MVPCYMRRLALTRPETKEEDVMNPRPLMAWRLFAWVGGLVVAIALLGNALTTSGGFRSALAAAGPAADPNSASYIGRDACGQCHAAQVKDWEGSHHALAMQPANEATVRGDFNDARFASGGGTTTFSRRDGKFTIRTDGPDGALHDYEVKFVFGVAPLEQYLIELPGGRLQAFTIAWDTRPQADGGQRWFPLHPGETIKAGDPLHWTGLQQNWNFECADCHSTNLERNYDPVSGTYKTTYSEIDVSCESCHGPGSAHAAWARKDAGWAAMAANKGLIVPLDERKGVSWSARSVNRQQRPQRAAKDDERDRDLRALPFPPRADRSGDAGRADRRQLSRGAARRQSLFSRRPDPRRSL